MKRATSVNSLQIQRAAFVLADLVEHDAEDEWRVTMQRLAFQYGPVRTLRIVQGDDRKTEADIAAWNKLGARA